MPAVSGDKPASGSCAIIVTYRPDMAVLLKLLSQLNRETDFLVIDNGSPEGDKYRQSIIAYTRCIDYQQLGENLGLATGLNLGLEEAGRRGYRYALLFDQDSGLSDLYVASMIGAFEQAAARGDRRIGAVGPRVINPNTRRPMPFRLFDRIFRRSDRPFAGASDLFEADFLITSGTLLKLETLADIGTMKAGYFIDNVDLEWCFRARSRGFALVGTDRALLYHVIGERSSNPLVKRGLIAQHSPQRSYYSSRNRVHLYRADYAPLGWKVRDSVRFLLKSCWLLLTSPQRLQYWQNIRQGIKDSRGLH